MTISSYAIWRIRFLSHNNNLNLTHNLLVLRDDTGRKILYLHLLSVGREVYHTLGKTEEILNCIP